MVDVQGLIWILAPTQGAKVGSPVQIDGYGTAFEATISWEVRKDGAVVAEGHTQGGANGEFGEFHDTVQLPAGDYELTAFESSAKDGSPIHIDTKNFTVKCQRPSLTTNYHAPKRRGAVPASSGGQRRPRRPWTCAAPSVRGGRRSRPRPRTQRAPRC